MGESILVSKNYITFTEYLSGKDKPNNYREKYGVGHQAHRALCNWQKLPLRKLNSAIFCAFEQTWALRQCIKEGGVRTCWQVGNILMERRSSYAARGMNATSEIELQRKLKHPWLPRLQACLRMLCSSRNANNKRWYHLSLIWSPSSLPHSKSLYPLHCACIHLTCSLTHNIINRR